MISKFLFSFYCLVMQSDLATTTAEQAEKLKELQEANELSRLTTILSIALITIFLLLIISLFKNNKLQNEIARLKQS